jgi:hypothetical protein
MRNVVPAFATALALAALCVPVFADQNSGYLKTKVNPGRTGVFIDGKYVGPAANFKVARKYPVAAGEHEIKLTEPRYEEMVTKVTIEPGKTKTLAETMKALPPPKPPFGVLRTICPDKFAAVYVNGKFMGHADEFSNSSQGLQLNPGDYTVRVSPVNGPEGKEEHVTIEANKVAIVHAGK